MVIYGTENVYANQCTWDNFKICDFWYFAWCKCSSGSRYWERLVAGGEEGPGVAMTHLDLPPIRYRWRMQDFSEEGTPTQEVCPTYYFDYVLMTTAWNWKKIDRGVATPVSSYPWIRQWLLEWLQLCGLLEWNCFSSIYHHMRTAVEPDTCKARNSPICKWSPVMDVLVLWGHST